MQPNTKKKKIIFPAIIYIYKHFTVENDLQRNKRSLRLMMAIINQNILPSLLKKKKKNLASSQNENTAQNIQNRLKLSK